MCVKPYMVMALIIVPFSLQAKPKVVSILEQGLLGIAKSQLGELQDQVGYMKSQLDIEKKIYQMEEQALHDIDRNLTGQYDFGKLYNGALDQAKRRWETRGDGAGEHEAMLAAHQKRFDFDAKGSFSSPAQQATFEQANQSQQKSIVAAQYVNKKLDENLEDIETLISKIDTTPNQKAATDLNSRIQGQLALELIELKRLQAMQLEALGSINQQYVNDKVQSASFNGLKEDK